eukprot:6463472-Amphidinium_carterae.1
MEWRGYLLACTACGAYSHRRLWNTQYPCGGYDVRRVGLARQRSRIERGLHPQSKFNWQLFPAPPEEWQEWQLDGTLEKLPGLDPSDL